MKNPEKYWELYTGKYGIYICSKRLLFCIKGYFWLLQSDFGKLHCERNFCKLLSFYALFVSSASLYLHVITLSACHLQFLLSMVLFCTCLIMFHSIFPSLHIKTYKPMLWLIAIFHFKLLSFYG